MYFFEYKIGKNNNEKIRKIKKKSVFGGEDKLYTQDVGRNKTLWFKRMDVFSVFQEYHLVHNI